MKIQEELMQLKEEHKSLTDKLQKLTEEKLNMVTSGTALPLPAKELDTSGLFNDCDNLESKLGLSATQKLGDSRSMEEKLLPEK